jgi:hypothetical protein
VWFSLASYYESTNLEVNFDGCGVLSGVTVTGMILSGKKPCFTECRLSFNTVEALFVVQFEHYHQGLITTELLGTL